MKIQSVIYSQKKDLKLDFKPTLAFLFFEGDKEEIIKDCFKSLREINPEIDVVGVNGSRGNISNNIPFISNENQISMLLFNCKHYVIETFCAENLEKLKVDFIKHYEYFENSASILFFPFEYDTNQFLDYIQDDKNMHNIYGGVYDTNNDIGCFCNGEFYKNKLISVLFNQDKIEFFSKSIHGWKPIGVSFTVTKSEKNIVYEIDGAPALQVIEEYIGKIKQENIDKFLHPFLVEHNNIHSLASLKEINRERKSIKFFKYLYEDEQITITIPINQQKMMNLIEKELQNIECDGLFMFSCVGRFAYYNELLEFEIEIVADFLKVPFAGFLTFGEIGSNEIHTKSILQNQTMNLIFFKEKK